VTWLREGLKSITYMYIFSSSVEPRDCLFVQ
jgi:hypothetical protein